MDFKSLLSLAKDNQSYNLKKFERDKLLKSKQDKNQVSDNAVKAYLAKKEREAKAKKDAEVKERQERILARLEGGGKKASDKKEKASSNPNMSKAHLQKRHGESMQKEDKRPSQKLGNPPKSAEKVEKSSKSALPGKSSGSSKQGSISANGKYPSTQHSKEKEKEIKKDSPKPTMDKTGAPVKKSGKTPVPKNQGLSFAELMKMAKEQANKPVSVQKAPVKVAEKKKIEEKQNHVDYERYEHEKLMKRKMKHRIAEMKKQERTLEQPREAPKREQVGPSSSSKVRVPDRAPPPKPNKCTLVTRTIGNTDLNKSRGGSGAGFKRPLPRDPVQTKKPKLNLNHRRLNSIDEELERERLELERKRKLFQNKFGGLPQVDDYDYYDGFDDYDDDEDDMDDFIDDSEATEDVSSEIRKIFGYDRRKYYDDDDDDLSSMEASFSQIQQEEARSARIAKLEDDIERLREIKELQREKKRSR